MPPSGEARSGTGGFRRKRSAAAVNRRKLGAVAERQWGVASAAQLARRGVDDAVVRRWVDSERLYSLYRGVLSTVPPSMLSVEGWHAAAVLLGGEGAVLAGASAAWWAGLIKQQPHEIEVAVRWDHENVDGIRWRRLDLRDDERIKHRRMPITALERIPLDLAPTMSPWDLKGVLAELEFHYEIGPEAVTLRRGYPGAAKLRQAIAEHTPQLAHTRSDLEKALVRFADERGFELPCFNVGMGPTTVDAHWPGLDLIVELDGSRAHAGERRLLRDHRRDLHRRREGRRVLRYHFAQLIDPHDQDLIEEELAREGVPRRLGWAA